MSPAPSFTTPTMRFDPYKSFRFRLKFEGRYVAGVSKVSGLQGAHDAVVKHREGDDPSTVRLAPGQTEFAPITLEHGVTHDAEFCIWANKVWDFKNSVAAGGAGAAEDFRKDLVLELYNEAGQKVMSYTLFRCWASEVTAVPELDAGGDAVAIQSLMLENEGWVRDTLLEEDDSFVLPST